MKIPDHLNRDARRKERAIGKTLRKFAYNPQKEMLTEDQLLSQDDDLGVWKSTLQAYTVSARIAQAGLQMGNVLQRANLSEQTIRDAFSDDEVRAIDAGLLIGQAVNNDRVLNPQFMAAYQAYRRPKENFTNEEIKALWVLMDDPDIPPGAVLREFVSYTTGMRDMAMMNVNFLQQQAKARQKAQRADEKRRQDAKRNIKSSTTESSEVVVMGSGDIIPDPQVIRGLNIGRRQLFATMQRWSISPEDLVPVRTEDLAETLVDIRDSFRTELSIKPISVAHALEFSTRDDVRKRAEMMKLQFKDPEMNKWLRVPRGADQIVVRELTDRERQTQQLVFFVAKGEVIVRDAYNK